MEYQPGDEYECEACKSVHVVERGKGLRVVGSSEQLDPRAYVRCPEAGVISLEAEAQASGPEDTTDERSEDWP